MNPSLQSKIRHAAPFLVLVFLFMSTHVGAQIYPPDGLRMPGDWNGWVNDPGMGGDFDLQLISQGQLRWTTTFQYTGETGTQNFKFVSTSFEDEWGNQWAGNTDVTFNMPETFVYGSPSDPDNTITVTAQNWYTVVFEDSGYEDTRAIFMETAQQPVELLTVSREPLMVSQQEPVTLTATLSAQPGDDEYFFVRYTTDGWDTSHMVAMDVEGEMAEATLPGQESGVEVEYYLLSSVNDQFTEDHDLWTLRMNNNQGSNYAYTVDVEVECGDQMQVVSTDPVFPREDMAVSVYFNAELGNGGLINFEGDVYAHTGVLTDESQDESDWKYVKTEWGENTPETMLTPLDDNLYVLEIDDIRDYYNVPVGEEILQMAFVFRGGEADEDGNYPEHKNADNSDILVTVYEEELTVKILSPDARDPLASPGQLLPVCVAALENETLALYLNDELLVEESATSLGWPLVLQDMDAGTHWIKAVAAAGDTQVKDSVAIYLRGPVQVEELPEGVVNGINYHDDHSVTLVLHDPPALKQHVFAIGDHSDWLPGDDNYMKRTPDGQHYWITLTGLEADTEYAFQYLIDGEMRLADPYAEKILDPWNDPWIPEETYPELKEFPYDKTTGIVSIMHPGREEYSWEITDFTPVAIHETQQDLVIYELLIRDFLESRHVTEVIDKLDYLEDLGVNAIQLMPIMEFDGNDSWGYAPNFFFATDKYYGTRQAYKAFIDACHARDIAVILDIVPNHAFGQSPMVNMYFDPDAGEYGQPLPENPWFNQQAPHPYSVGYDFNHESTYVREFFYRVFEYWLTEFNVDGYRIDLSKGLTQTYSGDDMGAWSAYDQSRIDILTDYYNHIKSINPDAYVILEHFAANDEETVLANTGMMLWGANDGSYRQVAMGYQDNADLSWSYHANRGWNYPNIIDYMENHDEERLMYEALTYGNASGDFNLNDTLTALEHMQMAAVLFLGIPGPKMIWQFGELGYDYSIFYGGGRTVAKPVRWDYWDMPQRQELHRVYRAMVDLRSSDAFRFGTFDHDFGGLGKRAWVSHESMNVVIAANMGVEGFDMAPGFQHGGTWYDYFSGDEVDVTDPSGHSLWFGPGDYRVFTSEPLDRPFYHFTVTVLDEHSEQPLEEARVELERSGSRITGAQGEAVFSVLEGEWDIEVSLEGYMPYHSTLTMDHDMDLVVLLSADDVGTTQPQVSHITVYPNPADGHFAIHAPEGARVAVYGLDGRAMVQYEATGEEKVLNTRGWLPGVYVVRASTNRHQSEAVKVVVY